MVTTAPAVGLPLAATLLLVGSILVRFAGSAGAETVPRVGGETGRVDIGRLPLSPFARHGEVVVTDADRPDGRTLVVYWLLGVGMLVAGVGLLVGPLL